MNASLHALRNTPVKTKTSIWIRSKLPLREVRDEVPLDTWQETCGKGWGRGQRIGEIEMSSFNTAAALKSGYEAVFTVDDYYDGPRGGVANFRGVPHFYECIFDEKSDDYSDSYLLISMSEEVFKAALENWEMFLRWRKAFDSGDVSLETHPALPRDRSRYEETKRTLDQAMESGRHKAIRVRGEFDIVREPNLPRDVLRLWQVRWS